MAVLRGGQDFSDDIQRDAEYAEEHMHHKVRWFGIRSPQTATQWCAPMSTNLANLYRCISGAGVYGADANDEAKVFGTADIPISGMITGDFDEILVIANSSSTVYLCRLVWGTGTLAAAIALDQYTEFPYFRATADTTRQKAVVPAPLIPITIGGLPVQIWMQCANVGDNATLDFVIGCHGYNF
jgi:hypothetical protein